MGIVRTEVGATFGIRTEVGMDRSGLVPKWVYPFKNVLLIYAYEFLKPRDFVSKHKAEIPKKMFPY